MLTLPGAELAIYVIRVVTYFLLCLQKHAKHLIEPEFGREL